MARTCSANDFSSDTRLCHVQINKAKMKESILWKGNNTKITSDRLGGFGSLHLQRENLFLLVLGRKRFYRGDFGFVQFPGRFTKILGETVETPGRVVPGHKSWRGACTKETNGRLQRPHSIFSLHN